MSTPQGYLLPGQIQPEEASVKKIFTAHDSFSAERLINPEVAKFFLCQVCGQYPGHAKISKMCLHMYYNTCVDNYKNAVHSSKCPPAHRDDDNVDICNTPSLPSDIVGISGFIKEIHESINIFGKNEHCDGQFTVKEIVDQGCTCSY